jgi:hypothetical protein
MIGKNASFPMKRLQPTGHLVLELSFKHDRWAMGIGSTQPALAASLPSGGRHSSPTHEKDLNIDQGKGVY